MSPGRPLTPNGGPARFPLQQEEATLAFTNPYAAQRSVLAFGAMGAVAANETLLGLLFAVRDARAARHEAHAYAAWEAALGDARRDAVKMGDIAKAAIVAALDAQDEAEALRVEVAQLRRAVAQREACIRALAV